VITVMPAATIFEANMKKRPDKPSYPAEEEEN
jgi:hypothetical protein